MEDGTKRALKILDEWGLLAAVGLSLFLSLLYFWPIGLLRPEVREFSQALITNLIPVLLVFAFSYLILRKAQALRADVDRRELVEAISVEIGSVVQSQFDQISSKVESTSQLVRDWDQKGVERVCSDAEIGAVSAAELEATDSLKIIGIGNGWLLEGSQHLRLERLLLQGAEVRILVPDPLSSQIRERYDKDEPDSHQLDLHKFASLVLQWRDFAARHSSLAVRVYNRYPMMNVSVYSRRVLASPILYRRRGKEGLTFVFRRPSVGSDIYEGHFDKVFETGSTEITADYLARLLKAFPHTATTR